MRETRSLRIGAVARALVSVALLIGIIFLPLTTKAYLILSAIVSLFICISIVYYIFADKPRWHDIILYTSAVVDGIVVALLPLIQYYALFEGQAPPEYLIKADVLLINKIDLLDHVDFDVDKVIADACKLNPGLKIFQVSAKTGAGMNKWYEWLLNSKLKTQNSKLKTQNSKLKT